MIGEWKLKIGLGGDSKLPEPLAPFSIFQLPFFNFQS